ncbi:MAG: Mur ligase domain-containing protein, partial [Thermodesulfobacteriota bacterium]
MYGKIKKLHFVGIGGIGMSGIAEVLVNMGYEISGSDINDSISTKRLQKLGIKIYLGHNASNIKGTDVVIISSAIGKTNPELIKAHEENIPVIARA